MVMLTVVDHGVLSTVVGDSVVAVTVMVAITLGMAMSCCAFWWRWRRLPSYQYVTAVIVNGGGSAVVRCE